MLLSGLMCLSLTACGALSSGDPTYPLAHLMNDCPGPAWQASGTNADLARMLQSYQLALDLCNADKEALRSWAEPRA